MTRRPIILYFLLAAACLAVFYRVAQFDFINYDDNGYVTGNPWVRGGFTRAGISWALTAIDYFYWQPVTWFSHMLDCQIFGLRPGWHHMVNVLFHMANSLLVFAIFRRMTGAFWRSAVVAALFAVHPLRVESVAWIAERKDVLSGFWFLAMVWLYLGFVARPSRWRYVLVLTALALGLMAKPMLIMAPVLLLLLDYWPLRRFAPAEKLPMFGMALFSFLITYAGTRRLAPINWGARIPLAHRIENTLLSYTRYLEMTVWPRHLALLYPYRISIAWWKPLAAAVLLAAITAVAIWVGRERRYVAMGWLWFAIALLPASGLVQVGRQSMGDRFTYLPLIGLLVLAVWGAAEVLRGRERLAVALAGVAVLAYGVAGWRQVDTWRDSVTVFTRTLAVTADNPSAQHYLAAALDQEGRFDEALPHHAEAVRLDEGYFVAQCSYGLALERRGEFAEAVEHLGEAVRYFPSYPEAEFHLGLDLEKLGRREEAAAALRKALEMGLDEEDARRAKELIRR